MKVYIKIDKKNSKSWFRWKKWKIINQKNYEKILKPYIKRNKKILGTAIEKYNFH